MCRLPHSRWSTTDIELSFYSARRPLPGRTSPGKPDSNPEASLVCDELASVGAPATVGVCSGPPGPRDPDPNGDTARRRPNAALINLEGVNVDRLEVRSQGRGFTIQTTNGEFHLTKPTPARADRVKVEALLRKLQTERVDTFVADNATSELDEFGLQVPQAEVAFGAGTNDVMVVQFGKNASNDLVYARRLLNNNIVLVSRSVVEALQIPAADLRDRHLVPAG